MLDEINAGDLKAAVIGEYFLPLLRRQLEVVIDDGGQEELVDHTTVRTYGATTGDSVLRARLELASAVTSGQADTIDWPRHFAFDDTDWSHGETSQELLERLRRALESEAAVTVTLTTSVRHKGTDEVHEGSLQVHVRRVEGLGSVRPLIIREGISLTADRTRSIHDHVAIIVADDGPVATLLGDAETPAHEELKHNLIKDKYVYPLKAVKFVREAPANLLRTVWETDRSDDPLLLASYFPLISDTGRTAERASRQARGQAPEPIGVIPRSPPGFRVGRIEGGFRIRNNPDAQTHSTELLAVVAYDVRRGSPFKRYREYDFNLATDPISVTTEGCEVAFVDGNKMTIQVSAVPYMVQVTGFDPRRDLVVRVTAIGDVP